MTFWGYKNWGYALNGSLLKNVNVRNEITNNNNGFIMIFAHE